MTITIPLWAAIIAPLCTALAGFFVCAWMTMAGRGDGDHENAARWQAMWRHALDTSIDNAAAHNRVSDALTAKQARIDRALEQITPGANATVKRIARILKGEA